MNFLYKEKRVNASFKVKVVLFVVLLINKEVFGLSFPSFEQSMLPNDKFNKGVLASPKWVLLQKLYNAWKLSIEKGQVVNNKIPKIIHHIWIGSPVPDKVNKLRKTWIKYHPDWEHKLWTEKEILDFGLKNINLYNQAKNYGEKSDIARYEILYRFGGLYIDTDFECFQAFDIFHETCSFYAGVAYNNEVEIFNGLIGASPNSIILKHCIESIKRPPGSTDTTWSILLRTGPFFFTKCFFEKIESYSDVAVAFPLTYFYGLPSSKKNDDLSLWLKPESYAVHLWYSSWMK